MLILRLINVIHFYVIQNYIIYTKRDFGPVQKETAQRKTKTKKRKSCFSETREILPVQRLFPDSRKK